ncbi:MAG: hypothetical protein ACYTF9_14075 [Planctomycetota bacterium]
MTRPREVPPLDPDALRAPLRRRRERRMLVGLPVVLLLIVAASGALAWKQRGQASEAVEAHARRVVLDPAPKTGVPGLDEILVGGRGMVGEGSGLTVVVTAGDEPSIGNGDASHHVLLTIDGQPWLGLRYRAEAADRLAVIGFWHPEGSSALADIVAPQPAE